MFINPSAAETIPPNFIQKLQSMTVKQGSQVTLAVRVTGTPTPVVKFFHEGSEIQSSRDFCLFQDGDLYSLVIAEAFPEDSGMFSVSATNSSGQATCTAQLLVQGQGLSQTFLLYFILHHFGCCKFRLLSITFLFHVAVFFSGEEEAILSKQTITVISSENIFQEQQASLIKVRNWQCYLARNRTMHVSMNQRVCEAMVNFQHCNKYLCITG